MTDIADLGKKWFVTKDVVIQASHVRQIIRKAENSSGNHTLERAVDILRARTNETPGISIFVRTISREKLAGRAGVRTKLRN
jgi:hypothetical protein